MDKNLINFLSKQSKINELHFPMDLYFLSERIGQFQNEESELNMIEVASINYKGKEKSLSVSPISTCFCPSLILKK